MRSASAALAAKEVSSFVSTLFESPASTINSTIDAAIDSVDVAFAGWSASVLSAGAARGRAWHRAAAGPRPATRRRDSARDRGVTSDLVRDCLLSDIRGPDLVTGKWIISLGARNKAAGSPTIPAIPRG